LALCYGGLASVAIYRINEVLSDDFVMSEDGFTKRFTKAGEVQANAGLSGALLQNVCLSQECTCNQLVK